MTNTAAPQSFETLPMPRKDMADVKASSYRVYKDADNFVTVQAPTALEALQTSGVTGAYKIERDNMDFNKVVGPNGWPKETAAVEPAAETPVAPPASQEASPAVAEAAKS